MKLIVFGIAAALVVLVLVRVNDSLNQSMKHSQEMLIKQKDK